MNKYWNETMASKKREPEDKDCVGPWTSHLFEQEVSVIRKDYKHGFHSWGWDGPAKVVIGDITNQGLNPKLRKIVKEEMIKFSKELAFCLNVADKAK